MAFNGAAPGSMISPNAQFDRTQLYLARAKLKATSRTSALLSGFAMIAMVELNLKKELPLGLLIVFGVCTVILVSVHLLALMISTCLLPHVEVAAGTAQDTNAALQQLLPHHHPSAALYHQQQHDQNQNQPHVTMKNYIELAWMCSTVIGIMLFLLEIGLIVWVQFWPVSHAATYTATVVLVPIALLFLMVIFKFYQRVISSRMKTLHYWLEQSKHFNESDEMVNGQSAGDDARSENGIQIV